MDLHALAGAIPFACLPLALLYPVANRIWGGDPRKFIGSKLWSGRRFFILLLVLVGIPLGYISAGVGGAVMPLLFGLWRAIIIGKDWATPDSPKEIITAFVRDMIPAALVALTIFICDQNVYASPFEWPLFWALTVHASLAVALAIRFARKETDLAQKLAAGTISKAECDEKIAEANGATEMLQGLSYAVAVIVWTLLR